MQRKKSYVVNGPTGTLGMIAMKATKDDEAKGTDLPAKNIDV